MRKETNQIYHGSPLIRTSAGHKRGCTKGRTVKFHGHWSKSQVLFKTTGLQEESGIHLQCSKFETSISTYNTNNEKMNITVLSGCINRVELQRIAQVGTSECCRWPY